MGIWNASAWDVNSGIILYDAVTGEVLDEDEASRRPPGTVCIRYNKMGCTVMDLDEIKYKKI